MDTVDVLVSDPGVTSGYCYASITPGISCTYYPFQIHDDVDELWKRLAAFKPRYIVMEDFKFRQGKQKSGINLFPVQLIGVARLYEIICPHQCALFMQQPAQGKGYYTNTVLKKLEFLRHGDITRMEHGLDATRHLFQWLTFGAGYKLMQGFSIKDFATRVDIWPTSPKSG